MDASNNNQLNKKPMSAMGITGIVLGAIALSTSFIPIVNNASAFFAVLGIIFGIIGAVGIFKGKKRNKIIAVIALAFNVLALIIVVASQQFYSDSLKSVTGNPAGGTAKEQSSEAKVGETIKMDNGLELTVTSIEEGLKNYDGSPACKISVKYSNTSNKEVSYANYDWKVESTQGSQTSFTLFTGTNGSNNQLSSGKLAAGGTISGDLYFKDDIKKIMYTSSLISNTQATWTK